MSPDELCPARILERIERVDVHRVVRLRSAAQEFSTSLNEGRGWPANFN